MDALETVRAYYAAVDSGDAAKVVGLFTADAVYERPGYAPMEGRRALSAFYESARVIDSGEHTVERAIVYRTQVAVQGRFRGFLKNGETADLRFADFFDVDPASGISRRTTYFYAPLV